MEMVSPKLLTVEEVVDLLSVSKAQVYKLINEGELPAVRIKRSVRVRPADVMKFIEMNLTV